MGKFNAIVLAYMLSVSSAIAAGDNNIIAAGDNNIFASTGMEQRAPVQEASAEVTASAAAIFAELIGADQGVKRENIRITITKGTRELQAASGSDIRVVSLKIDQKFDNFYATVSTGNSQAFEVSGKFEKLRRIPVLSRKMGKDEVIAAADITYMDVNERILKRGIITDENELLGKGIARVINEKRPIQPSSLAAAKLVLKGNLVNAVYKSASITLQNTVVAMEDGAEGDVIRLKNETSNRVIHGKITGKNAVELVPFNNQVASN